MKKIPIILYCLFFAESYSQCRNTLIYGFELAGFPSPELVTATVFYKGKPIIPKTETICGKSSKIRKQFSFIKNSTKILDGVKLPYQLPGKRFYWLMTDEMNIEMATHPDHFKIILDSKDKHLKSKYELPVSYDFLSQNAVYLDLIDKSTNTIQKEFKDKIWQFGIYEREKKQVIKDTIMVYSVREKIPAGIMIRFPEIKDSNINSVQEFQASGMLFKQKLFLKTPENRIQKPDAPIGLYISLEGKKCATSGGLTGIGFGECAGANVQKDKKNIPYKINIQIEP